MSSNRHGHDAIAVGKDGHDAIAEGKDGRVRLPRAAKNAAGPAMREHMAVQEAFDKDEAKKKKRAKTKPRVEPIRKKEKRANWDAVGCGRVVATGRIVEDPTGHIEDAPVELKKKYGMLEDTAAYGRGNLTDLFKQIFGQSPIFEGGECLKEDFWESMNRARGAEKNATCAISRLSAIQSNSYWIERVAGGTITKDGGHVLGRKKDYEQGHENENSQEYKSGTLQEFESICSCLGIEGAAAIMDAKVTYDDCVQNKKGFVDETPILNDVTLKLVVRNMYTKVQHLLQPILLSQYDWLVWSLVWHSNNDEKIGSVGYLLETEFPDLNWNFIKSRDRQPSAKCIENNRQKDMVLQCKVTPSNVVTKGHRKMKPGVCQKKREKSIRGQVEGSRGSIRKRQRK